MSIVFITAIAVFQIASILISFVIYKALTAAFGVGGWFLLSSLMGLSLTLIVASILATWYKNKFVRLIHYLSRYWFAFMGPLFCASAAFVFIEDAASILKWQIDFAIAGSAVFGAALLLCVYGVWESNAMEITRITVAIQRLPAFWRGKTIAFISDVHLGDEYGVRFAAKLVQKISSLAPQAVFIGGDLFDGVKCDPEKLLLPFRKLQPPRGTYFVSGNHEYSRDIENFFHAIRHTGVMILKNEKKTIEGIDFWGIDYKTANKRKDFEKLVGEMKIDSARPSVFIKHIPDNLDVAEKAGASLQLSGHTHHGQIFPLNYLTRTIFKGYDYGLKQFGKMAVYTTSGVGASPAPFRFGTKSEIVLIKFK